MLRNIELKLRDGESLYLYVVIRFIMGDVRLREGGDLLVAHNDEVEARHSLYSQISLTAAILKLGFWQEKGQNELVLFPSTHGHGQVGVLGCIEAQKRVDRLVVRVYHGIITSGYA